MSVSKLRKLHSEHVGAKRLMAMAICLCCLQLVCVHAPTAQAADATVAWGTISGESGSTFNESASLHNRENGSALQQSLGRDAPPPGTSITSIGTFNNITLENSDGNTLNSEQLGTNTGTVVTELRRGN